MKPLAIWVALLLLVASAASAAQQLLSPSEFRDRVAKAAVASAGGTTTIIDEEAFRIKQASGDEITVNTANAYQDYRADPARITPIIDRFVRLLVNPAPQASPDQLVIIVRPSTYIRDGLPPGASLDTFPTPQPLAGDLAQFLAIDSPETIQLATKGDLSRWGLDEPAAWERARRQLPTWIGPLSPVQLGDRNELSGLGADSGLAPSILADPAMCGPTAPAGFEARIVLVFARDLLLFVDASDRAAAKRFWDVVKRVIAQQRSLSETPLTCSGGRWVTVPIP